MGQGPLEFLHFEIMFCHEVREPLKILTKQWLGNYQDSGLSKTVSEPKESLRKYWKITRDNLKVTR